MAVQKGRDMLLKISDGEAFVTVAGLRARTVSLNAKTVDVTDSGSGGWRELLAGAGGRSLSVFGRVSGDTVSWLRSPRYGGDSWETEPPLCEDYELYRVQVFDGEALVREVEVSSPGWVYAERVADFPGGFGADARVEIAQKSQVYGYGPVLRLALA